MTPASAPFDEFQAVKCLTSLGQAQRLRVFRALAAQPMGVSAGCLAQQMDSSPSALSFHLKELSHAGLIDCEPRGRNLIYSANLSRLAALQTFLSEHCCQDAALPPACDPSLHLSSPTSLRTTMATEQPVNVLFLCAHNSARSIIAEAILNHIGKGRMVGYSAGQHPKADQQPNPMALHALKLAGISTAGLRSKSWDEYSGPEAPKMDLIVTVCDETAKAALPVWPGRPATAHWGLTDPTAGDGTDLQKAASFLQTLHSINRRLEILVNLPADKLHSMVLQQSARDIGHSVASS